MKILLEKLYNHQILDQFEARQLLFDLVNGAFNSSQIASFLTVLIMRKIRPEELIGFRDALMELAVTVDLGTTATIDMCGTGGDGKNTFNISTLAAFVVAGAGIPVAKHGNYGASSISGSSNVLETLGMKFTARESVLKEQLEKANICFLHAPLFHPALKYVAPIRAELGVKTFFNMLGPLVNPASPKVRLVGVFSLEVARLYQHILKSDSQNRFSIVHTLGGYDEITLTDKSKILTHNKEYWVDSETFGTDLIAHSSLYGGNTVAAAAAIFMDVLKGNGTQVQNNVVLANAALAIQTYFPKLTLDASLEQARESLYGAKALASFNALKSINE